MGFYYARPKGAIGSPNSIVVDLLYQSVRSSRGRPCGTRLACCAWRDSNNRRFPVHGRERDRCRQWLGFEPIHNRESFNCFRVRSIRYLYLRGLEIFHCTQLLDTWEQFRYVLFNGHGDTELEEWHHHEQPDKQHLLRVLLQFHLGQ